MKYFDLSVTLLKLEYNEREYEKENEFECTFLTKDNLTFKMFFIDKKDEKFTILFPNQTLYSYDRKHTCIDYASSNLLNRNVLYNELFDGLQLFVSIISSFYISEYDKRNKSLFFSFTKFGSSKLNIENIYKLILILNEGDDQKNHTYAIHKNDLDGLDFVTLCSKYPDIKS